MCVCVCVCVCACVCVCVHIQVPNDDHIEALEIIVEQTMLLDEPDVD
jgi:hypothetical protein